MFILTALLIIRFTAAQWSPQQGHFTSEPYHLERLNPTQVYVIGTDRSIVEHQNQSPSFYPSIADDNQRQIEHNNLVEVGGVSGEMSVHWSVMPMVAKPKRRRRRFTEATDRVGSRTKAQQQFSMS